MKGGARLRGVGFGKEWHGSLGLAGPGPVVLGLLWFGLAAMARHVPVGCGGLGIAWQSWQGTVYLGTSCPGQVGRGQAWQSWWVGAGWGPVRRVKSRRVNARFGMAGGGLS